MTSLRRLGRVTFIDSDRPLARYLARPIQRFIQIEAAGAILLLGATVVALVWANSPWRAGYASLIHTEIGIEVGSFELREDLVHWVNDGLMALFFFVVGLEIKREWVVGELRDRRAAALPAIAALGGMVAPALLYLALNGGGPGERGWGVPVATDIAFALGVVALLGSRVPGPLKLFLLTLAIVDDIGAIVVIAVVYTDTLHVRWLVAAIVLVGVVVVLRQARVVNPVVFVVVGLAMWLCALESGIHATIAGVAMGLLTPALPFQDTLATESIVDTLEGRADLEAEDVRRVSFLLRSSLPLTDVLERLLHPWTSYLVIPLFALANAGIAIDRSSVDLGSPVQMGIVVGLVVGKTVGVTGGAWLAVRFGLGTLPEGVRWSQLVGVAMLAGIGFTVSLFVTGLAFPPGALQDQAKVGVLIASVTAAALGSVVVTRTARRGSTTAGPAPVTVP